MFSNNKCPSCKRARPHSMELLRSSVLANTCWRCDKNKRTAEPSYDWQEKHAIIIIAGTTKSILYWEVHCFITSCPIYAETRLFRGRFEITCEKCGFEYDEVSD